MAELSRALRFPAPESDAAMKRALLLLILAFPAVAADYYVSPTGQDEPSGGGAGNPWKTIGYALGRVGPGDTVHLEAGATFAENVYFGSAGAPGLPLTLISDPANCATIQQANATSEGLLIWNTGHVTLENLVVTGFGTNVTTKAGVAAMTDNGRYAGLTFRNVTVSGFREGIVVYGWGSTSNGFHTVLIEACHAHHNLNIGGQTWAEGVGGISNIVVRGCRFNDNYGDPAATGNSGSGFVFGRTRDGLIEHCIAHDNGGWGNATEGPVGLWAYDSAQITIQFCEAYRNQAKHMDGDGFDLDQNTTDSVIQYCYSHDNYGAGYLLCNGDTGAWTNNIVRYCISENDGTGGNMGGLHFYAASSAGLKNSQVYGNTIYNRVAPAVWFHSFTGMAGLTLRNNLFITADNKKLANGSPTTAQALLQGNDYWPSGGTFDVAGYSSLAAWRSAKNQEMLSGQPVGYSVDPRLSAPGGGTTDGYLLQADSPLIDAGLQLTNPGPQDFFGNALPQGATYDVGAHDTKPTISIGGIADASEFGPSNGTFVISRTGGTVTNLPVNCILTGTSLNGTDYAALTNPVTIPAGATNVIITVAPSADALAEGDETVLVTLVASNLYALGTSVASITIHDLPVDAWRFQHFGGNPPGSADGDDYDGDGLPNLLEYALNMNPTVPGATGLPTFNANREFNFLRARAELTYEVQSSTNLIQWSLLAINPGSVGEDVTVLFTNNEPCGFLRLKVTRP